MKFLENSAVRTTSIGAILIAVFAFAYTESAWRTNIQRDVQETRVVVSELKTIVQKGTTDRFTYSQFQTWVTRFKELNDGCDIRIPTLPARIP